ncbi:cytochrome P450 [Paraburkholderia sp. D15]|uniref:cytochrome P450 n=1 Tax=Paraburkholderia sp. D15 TaxID=2880218 RepID=UPI0024792B7D|nr:cytochrome P450 [Paraburkholderia sp. D15]WGS51167.1 cytochrome P450 [Paraburkholderia sp. D15]
MSSRFSSNPAPPAADATERLRFNPLEAGFRQDPYPLYARLRDEAPYLRTLGMLVLTRHADVRAALRERRLSVDLIPATLSAGAARLKIDGAQQVERFIRNSIVFTDSPEHLRLRRLINQAYTPAALARLDAVIAREVDALLAPALAAGCVEAIGELAAPLPLHVLCAWMGVPADARASIGTRIGALRALLDPGMMTRAHYGQAIASTADLTRWFVAHARDGAASRDGDSLIARLAAARSDGDRLSETEVAFACIMSFVAGNETTQCLVGNTLDMLLSRPDDLARLRERPELIDAAIEESIRYQSPLQLTKRVAPQALEINGHGVARGEQILLCLGAANRDASVFDAPDEVRIEREPGAQLGFGSGMHACLGGALARRQARACLVALLERTETIERAGDAGRWQTRSLILRGLDGLPIRLVRRGASLGAGTYMGMGAVADVDVDVDAGGRERAGCLVGESGADMRPPLLCAAGSAATPSTLASLARYWATHRPERRAFVFLGADNQEIETLSFAQLDAAARRVALQLSTGAAPGSRALLMFPSGLSFIVAFFACHYAGLVPVPLAAGQGLRLRDAVLSIALDSQPALLLTTPASLDACIARFADEPALRTVRCMSVAWRDHADRAEHARVREHVENVEHENCADRAINVPCTEVWRSGASSNASAADDDLAFIQYTSGSTSAPKGVCVTHANLFANLRMQRIAMGHAWGSAFVGWAPLHHDMGLIANVLEPFYLGGLAVLMSPAQFAQSPWLWLRAISRYRARASGGPDFAFALCVARRQRILDEAPDLSCWRLAFNSAEPVRADTLRAFAAAFAPLGFRAEALYPCYGMAEATLLVSGGAPRALPAIVAFDKAALERGKALAAHDASPARELVGCGQALSGERLAIVEPRTSCRLPEGRIGEIWVHGPHIPHAYWNQPAASGATLRARLADENASADTGSAATASPSANAPTWLRTGDLGFLLDGELFITGRLKDVLVLRGRNLYPQDVERHAEQAFAGLRPNASAAIAGDAGQIVLIQEVERSARRNIDVQAAVRTIRRAVLHEFEFTLHDIVLVEPGSIPKTSSGKIRRAETRARLLAGTLDRLAPIRTSPAMSTRAPPQVFTYAPAHEPADKRADQPTHDAPDGTRATIQDAA